MNNTQALLQRALSAAAATFIAASAHAVVLPVAEDSASSATGQLTAVTGKAKTLSVSKTATIATRAYLDFNVAATGLTPADVTEARLKIYITTATTAGALQVSPAATEWHEAIPGVAPTATGTPVSIPLASVVKQKFILVDVTQIVKDWLTTPASDFGFIVEAPTATTKVALGSKEGSAGGYPAELELDLTAAAGSIGSASLDPNFVATLPMLGQANTFTSTNTFTFGSGARTITIQDDSSGKTPVINIGGTGINAGTLRLRNALHIFPSDDNSRAAQILLHDSAGVSTIGLFGSNGAISGSSLEVQSLGVSGTSYFSFSSGGPAKLLFIQPGVDLSPELVVADGGTGILRVRNNLQVWPSTTGANALFDVRNSGGLATIVADGNAGSVSADSVQATNLTATNVTGDEVVGKLMVRADKFLTLTPASPSIANGTTLNPAGSFLRVSASSGAATTLNATTAIADGSGANPGQVLILQGTSDTGTIAIPDNANTQLGAATRTLGANDTLSLIWNGTDWIETAFSNN